MANEITFSAALAVTKSGLTASASASKSVDMSGANFIADVQEVGITTEALSFGDVTTPGYLYLKNLDATNFVQISLSTPVTSGNAFCKLKAGEFTFIPQAQTVIYALADTAGISLQKIIIEA